MYNSYVGFSEYNEDIVLHFQGYPASIARAFWKNSLRAYLNTNDARYISEVEDKVRCLAYADLIDWKRRHSDLTNEEDRATVELWTRNLTAILEHVDFLSFDLHAEETFSGEQLVIEATADNLPHVLAFVNEQLERVNCPIKTQMQISVAAEEIFVNIANYAYAPKTGPATIRLSISEDPAVVTVTFIDSGVPFDPLEKIDPDVSLPAEDREIGGLGIFITKKIMDDVHYEYKNGYNCLTMIKKM
ncbi:MAG: ATP-binding protein [Parasporobacterium sp.]|nr:ATP-binding protein [Parasporobacterium sp.]